MYRRTDIHIRYGANGGRKCVVCSLHAFPFPHKTALPPPGDVAKKAFLIVVGIMLLQD